MNNKIVIELPDSVYTKLVEVIEKTIEETLQKHIDAIRSEPERKSRSETASYLKISLPTLRKLEACGKLIPERSGRKLLYSKRAIEDFLNSK